MTRPRVGTKRALITGITGQDGSYLAEFLLSKGYEVHGMMRRASSFNRGRIDHLFRDPAVEGRRVFRHYGDLTDESSIRRILRTVVPDEVYNLGAQSHVRVSFDIPLFTLDAGGLGVLRLLEAVRGMRSPPRIYQASSSEMFGSSPPPQDEGTRFHPRSPYGCAKTMAFHQVVHYREAFGLFAVSGILFNHESPRRGESFVTRKITRAAGRIKLGLQDHVVLGNLDARRDWGFAGDYVRAMWLMLQQEEPEDFVIGTGESHSVREFCEAAFGHLGLDWKEHVRYDRRYLRPSEVDHLRSDPSRARRRLGWKPEVGFGELVRMMVENDLRLAERERILRDAGHAVREGGDA